MADEQIQRLQEMLDRSEFTLVITGAGISIASGIPSFHDGGMDMKKGFQFASNSVLKATPEHYYRIVRELFLDAVFENGPSLSHRKLAELEGKGKVSGIITTNIDNLHSIAGSRNVAEIQGSFGVNVCLRCGRRNLDVNIWNQGHAPRCECGGLYSCWQVYAHIGLYDEAVRKAREWAERADLVIVAGTTGNYSSAYWNHISPRVQLVQINPTSTPFDASASLNIRKSCDEVFAFLN